MKDNVDLRECSLALLHVFSLSARSGLPAYVNGDAHEESTLVEEVAGDIDAHQQQEKDHDEDSYDGSHTQAWTGTCGVWKVKTRKHKRNRQERRGEERVYHEEEGAERKLEREREGRVDEDGGWNFNQSLMFQLWKNSNVMVLSDGMEMNQNNQEPNLLRLSSKNDHDHCEQQGGQSRSSWFTDEEL